MKIENGIFVLRLTGMRIAFFWVLGCYALVSSCTINTDLMLRTDKEYVYAELTDSMITSAREYHLAPSDIIQFRLFDNNGASILNDGISMLRNQGGGMQANARLNQNNQLRYLIERDSTAKLPIFEDRIQLAGLTIRAAEDTLESMYGKYFEEPFVQIQVLNKRVIVFPGDGGQAQVVPLSNNNMTLVEVLAVAGGIANRGNAEEIKLMRNVDGTRYVYHIKLGTIEGLKYADMIMQANDYIYVEPVPEVGREILQDLAPIISIVSSALIVYTVINTLTN